MVGAEDRIPRGVMKMNFQDWPVSPWGDGEESLAKSQPQVLQTCHSKKWRKTPPTGGHMQRLAFRRMLRQDPE